MGASTYGTQVYSANPARRFVSKPRDINLNDPSMLEIIKRDARPKQQSTFDHTAKQDHAIFEGLDNSKLLSCTALA